MLSHHDMKCGVSTLSQNSSFFDGSRRFRMPSSPTRKTTLYCRFADSRLGVLQVRRQMRHYDFNSPILEALRVMEELSFRKAIGCSISPCQLYLSSCCED
jgi:hypothetical protein